MLNICKALDSHDESHKCYMSLACCHEMLEESRCIYVDKVKVFTEPIHSSYNLQLLHQEDIINGCIDRIDRARKYL